MTDKLLHWKERLVGLGVTGILLLDGSYVSAKENPSDFDVMLVAQPSIQALKDMSPDLQGLLDHGHCEGELGFTVFYFASDSGELDQARGIWDYAKDGTPKGVLEVPL